MSQQQGKGKSDGPCIHGQLSAIMAAVEAVGKDRRNSGQGFSYRGIEDIMDALHPIFAEHKVFVLSEVLEDKTEERVTLKGGTLIYRVLKVKVSFVSGEDGSRESVVVIGEGMDSGDKAANKAMSAALKYALTQTLILPYGAVDGDADTPPDSQPKTAVTEPPKSERKSAYDGRKMAPGEDPRPPKHDAFNSRLYDAMSLVGVTSDELNADLRSKGIMAGSQTIDTLPERIVNLLLDGKDKSGRGNWDIVVDRIKKARTA